MRGEAIVLYVCKQFSAGMLPDRPCTVRFRHLAEEEAARIVRESRFVSLVGGKLAARLASAKLGAEIPPGGGEAKLSPGDAVLCLGFELRLRPEGGFYSPWHVEAVWDLWLAEIGEEPEGDLGAAGADGGKLDAGAAPREATGLEARPADRHGRPCRCVRSCDDCEESDAGRCAGCPKPPCEECPANRSSEPSRRPARESRPSEVEACP